MAFIGLIVVMFVAGYFWNTQPSIVPTNWQNHQPIINDNLAANLGKGFELNFDNEAWLARFSLQNTNHQYDWVYAAVDNGVTSAHFPGPPFLIRVFANAPPNSLFLLGLIPLAISLAILVNLIRVDFGWAAALACLAILVVDGAVFQFSQSDPSIAIVTSLVTFAFVAIRRGSMASQVGKRAIVVWPMAGLFVGGTTLFALSCNLWLIVVLPVSVLAFAYRRLIKKSDVPKFESLVLFWIGVLLIAAPWWIRNCKTTQSFQPLGNSVGLKLQFAYSDLAIEGQGNLNVSSLTIERSRIQESADIIRLSLVEQESMLQSRGQQEARKWINEHVSQIGPLILARLGNHFGLSSQQSTGRFWFCGLVLLGAIVGCTVGWQRGGNLTLCAIFATTVVTAMTWSDFEQQFIPVRPLLDISCGIGLATLALKLRRRIGRGNVQPTPPGSAETPSHDVPLNSDPVPTKAIPLSSSGRATLYNANIEFISKCSNSLRRPESNVFQLPN